MTGQIMRRRSAALTDRGLHRADNQDNLYLSPDERLYVIADGMGGTANGARASSLAVETIEQLWSQPCSRETETEVHNWLEMAVSSANARIYEEASEVACRSSRMGTTIVAAVHTNDGLLQIAHVGDSRAYLIRSGKATPLTVDHSVVMEMHKAKQLTEKQAWSSIYRNLLTRCLGHEDEVKIDITSVVIEPGDWVVLCTDGLNSVLEDDTIGRIVSKCSDPNQACRELLNHTLKKDAPDNVTILAIQYSCEPEQRKSGKFAFLCCS